MDTNTQKPPDVIRMRTKRYDVIVERAQVNVPIHLYCDHGCPRATLERHIADLILERPHWRFAAPTTLPNRQPTLGWQILRLPDGSPHGRDLYWHKQFKLGQELRYPGDWCIYFPTKKRLLQAAAKTWSKRIKDRAWQFYQARCAEQGKAPTKQPHVGDYEIYPHPEGWAIRRLT